VGREDVRCTPLHSLLLLHNEPCAGNTDWQSSLGVLWMEARMIFKRSDRRVDLRVEPTHALLDVGVDAVA
jgi:hypothetical protein